MISVRLCKSCAVANAGVDDINAFTAKVEAELQTTRPDLEWKVERDSCMKACPRDRITMAVSSSKNPQDVRLTFSKKATLDSVVEEVLTFFPPRK